MEEQYLFQIQGFSEKELFEQLDSALIKESEILDEDTLAFEGTAAESYEYDKPLEFKGITQHQEKPSVYSQPQLQSADKFDFESDQDYDEAFDSESGIDTSNSPSKFELKPVPAHEKAGNYLLRRTISELEHALSDTRQLLADRDTENSKVRTQLISVQSRLEEEQSKYYQLEQDLTEKENIIAKLEKLVVKEQDEISNLQAKISRNETKRRKESCTDSSEQLVTIEEANVKLEHQIEGLKAKLRLHSDENAAPLNKLSTAHVTEHSQARSKCKHMQREKDLQTKLRMKFMRDAFFYYMIDYHAEEQLRAILAILDYEDKRPDLILESYRMRQKGRKFTVSQVSSRKLTFVQEEQK